MQILEDYKELLKSNGELDYKADGGMEYKEMYDDFYLEWLHKLCKKYDIDFNKNEIDWEWCNYIQNKQYELEKTLEEKLLISDTNKCILQNINGDEKFKIICRAKDIDIDEICRDIIDTIEYSDIEDKQSLISKNELWDEDYISVIKEYNELHIDETFLFDREEAINFFEVSDDEIDELWVELNEAEKELIQIALDCKVYDIECDMG